MMKILAATALLLVGVSMARGQKVHQSGALASASSKAAGRVKTRAEHVRAGGAATTAAMSVDSWFSLEPPPSVIAAPLARKLDTTVAKDGTEEITVYGRRGPDRDAEWRGDARASAPIYEAGNSDAAQRLYASGPEWTSPEQQHLMSDAKDAMGLCGALSGWVTCPNK